MRRVLCLLLAAALFLTSCSINKKQTKLPEITQKITDKINEVKPTEAVETESKNKTSMKAVGLVSSEGYNISFLRELGFDTIIVRINGIRIAGKPYKTNFEELNRLKRVTADLDAKETNYIIEITSGPGYSSDGTVNTLFSKKSEKNYFSQMAKEVVKRFEGNKYFKGISIKLDAPDIPEKDYYDTQDYIINKVRETYPDLTVLYNLHPLTFENGLKNIPLMTNEKNILNLTIFFKGISYPGYGAAYRTSVDIDKNEMLKRFQTLKKFETDNNQHLMITIQTPWAEKSDVFVQDMFEIFKMIGFDYSLSYGNSFDIFDFSKNKEVVNVLRRHSK